MVDPIEGCLPRKQRVFGFREFLLWAIFDVDWHTYEQKQNAHYDLKGCTLGNQIDGEGDSQSGNNKVALRMWVGG